MIKMIEEGDAEAAADLWRDTSGKRPSRAHRLGPATIIDLLDHDFGPRSVDRTVRVMAFVPGAGVICLPDRSALYRSPPPP